MSGSSGAGFTTRQAAAPAARRRWVLFLLSMVPVAALVALLAWASARSPGNPVGVAVNDQPGRVAVAARPAPPFSLDRLDGGATISNESLRGRVVMLDFWSSWCPPCRQEAPVLQQVYREYAAMPVEFVGVALWDDPGEVLRHIDRYQVGYPNAIDGNGVVAIDFGVLGIPEKFFLDRRGQLVHKYIGPMDPDTLRDILDGLLASE